jgi:hypothetical protein
MKPLQLAKYITLFFIVLTIIIAFINYKNNNFKLSTYEILILILLLCISIGVHYIIVFLNEIDSTDIIKTLNNISNKGLLGSLIKL